MYFTFVYNGSYDYDGYTVQLDDYEYSIRDNKDDVIEYLYEKHFDRPYSGYYVGTEEMNYVSELENKWLYNEIDFIALYYEDYAFKDWLKDKYVEDAIEQYLSEVCLEDLYDYDDEDEEDDDEWE